MKILMISENYLPTVGGVTRHVSSLSRQLVSRGHEVNIFCSNRLRPKRLTIDHLEGVRVFRFPLAAERFHAALQDHKQLFSKVDIIHVHDFHPCLRYIFPVCAEMPNLPVFVTFHGHEGRFPVDPNIRRLRQACWKLALGTVNAGRFIEEWYDTPADLTLYGGIDGELLTDSAKLPDNYEFVFTGRLEEDNPIEIYLRALQLLQEQGIPVSFTVCGGGSKESAIRQLAESLEFPVKMIAQTYEVACLRNQARFIFAGGYLSILEAFAAGRVAFTAYHTPGRKSYILNHPAANEILLVGGSGEELKDKILSVIKHRELEETLIRRGTEFVNDCTWEKVCEAYLHLWEKRSNEEHSLPGG
jgi:glycosyltransferase involved in cell wall biosynthesis